MIDLFWVYCANRQQFKYVRVYFSNYNKFIKVKNVFFVSEHQAVSRQKLTEKILIYIFYMFWSPHKEDGLR